MWWLNKWLMRICIVLGPHRFLYRNNLSKLRRETSYVFLYSDKKWWCDIVLIQQNDIADSWPFLLNSIGKVQRRLLFKTNRDPRGPLSASRHIAVRLRDEPCVRWGSLQVLIFLGYASFALQRTVQVNLGVTHDHSQWYTELHQSKNRKGWCSIYKPFLHWRNVIRVWTRFSW